jgi:hypothetical protein
MPEEAQVDYLYLPLRTKSKQNKEIKQEHTYIRTFDLHISIH